MYKTNYNNNNKSKKMKSKFLFPIVLFAGLMVVNFAVNQVNGQTTKSAPAKQQTVLYTCSMHPEVVQDKPGNCPKCGMKLVEKKDEIKESKHHSKDSCSMKHENKKMMCDSTNMHKGHMMHDSTSLKHEHKGM
jgi:hypothetical protein